MTQLYKSFSFDLSLETSCQRLGSIRLAAVERNGELSHNDREEKQYAHGCWLTCVPMPVAKLITFKSATRTNEGSSWTKPSEDYDVVLQLGKQQEE